MNVLSLFDGMGCGWIALRELGIKVDRGYSSEVDKYAIVQTVPKWYIWNCSDTQQYKMLGNGWTVEVIKHILSFIKIKES